MSEKENSSKELVIVDAEWSESEEGGQGDGSSRVHVMSGCERRSYEGETIDENGERVGTEPEGEAFRPHVYVVNSSSGFLSKLVLILVAAALLWFIVFVALPVGFVFVVVAAAAWYLRSWWQKYM